MTTLKSKAASTKPRAAKAAAPRTAARTAAWPPPAIEVLTDGEPGPGVVAHRRTRSNSRWKRLGEGDPSAAWPACMTKHAKEPEGGWRSYGAGWAAKRGAEPCDEKNCFPGAGGQ